MRVNFECQWESHSLFDINILGTHSVNVYIFDTRIFTEVLTNNASSKREILQQIINSNKENVISLLKDYCCSFGFNFNDCLLRYLQVLLKTWTPTITISNTSINKGK